MCLVVWYSGSIIGEIIIILAQCSPVCLQCIDTCICLIHGWTTPSDATYLTCEMVTQDAETCCVALRGRILSKIDKLHGIFWSHFHCFRHLYQLCLDALTWGNRRCKPCRGSTTVPNLHLSLLPTNSSSCNWDKLYLCYCLSQPAKLSAAGA